MPYHLTQDEQIAYDLLCKSNEPQIDDLCLRLGISVSAIPTTLPIATRYRHVWDIVKNEGGTGLAILEEQVRKQQKKPQAAYGLYVSRANADEDDPLSSAFFQNLGLSLQRKGLFQATDIRYLDRINVQEPEVWWPWSLRAMQQSKILLCLYTKEYFSTPYCGQIWSAFLGRLREHFGHYPPLILPLLWGPPGDNPSILPRVARTIEFAHEEFGATYCEKGLKFIQKWSARDEYMTTYDAIVEKLATKIVNLTNKYPISVETNIPPLKDIPNAFKEFIANNEEREEVDADYAKFVFIAATRDEIRGLRTPGPYGVDHKQWMPYHPHSKEHVERTTQKAAAEARRTYDVIRLDENFVTGLQWADSNKEVIVILVDPWTIQLGGSYLTYAKQYDDNDLPNSKLLVCWNNQDDDTSRQTRHLQRTLQKTFERKMRTLGTEVYQGDIGSIDQLRRELARALLSSRRHIVDEAEEPRMAQGVPFHRPASISERTNHADIEVRRAEDERFPRLNQPVVEGPLGGTAK
jgi:FxsC-like protein